MLDTVQCLKHIQCTQCFGNYFPFHYQVYWDEKVPFHFEPSKTANLIRSSDPCDGNTSTFQNVVSNRPHTLDSVQHNIGITEKLCHPCHSPIHTWISIDIICQILCEGQWERNVLWQWTFSKLHILCPPYQQRETKLGNLMSSFSTWCWVRCSLQSIRNKS